MQESEHIVDYVFIGLGAANSLIIRQMHAQDMLYNAYCCNYSYIC